MNESWKNRSNRNRIRSVLIAACTLPLLSASADSLYCAVIKDIRIFGNLRIEKESILFDLPFKPGTNVDGDVADISLKALNRTGYFKTISTKFKQGILSIFVRENPVINRIAYEGINHSMREAMKDVIKLKPRQVLSMENVQEVQQILLDMYKSQGYLNATVTPKVVRLSDNRVDVVFEAHEGDGAYIKRINFIGNKTFSSKELRDVLNLQERHWYHFKIFRGIVNKTYDPEKFMEDQKNLIKFYLNRGYADFEIISSTAELSPDKKDFYLTYKVREGDIYKFGKASVEADLKNLDTKVLEAALIAKEGLVFNDQIVEICCRLLKDVAKRHGYNFTHVEPIFTKNRANKTIDIKFQVRDRAKIFIEKVNINGNTGTRDFVIRREINFEEGDPFDQHGLKDIEERIKGLGYFKTVKIEPKEGSHSNQVILNVNVEEQKTAEVFASAGYAQYDGATVSVHMYNPNFVGRGQSLGFDWSLAKKTADFSVDFAEPHFLGRNLLGQSSFFYSRSKRFTGLVRKQVGGLVSLGYKLLPRLTQNWAYKLHREEVSRNAKQERKYLKRFFDSQASLGNEQLYKDWLEKENNKDNDAKKLIDPDDIGTHWGSAIIHTLTYDRRNRRMLPSKGFRLSWKTQFSGLGGSICHLINTWSGSFHQKLYKDLVLNLRASFSHGTGLFDHDLRIVDSLYVGGESLRGFDFYGITPVRGLPKKPIGEAFDRFVEKDHEFLDEKEKTFLKDKKEILRHMITGGQNSDSGWDRATAEKLSGILRKATKKFQEDAIQIRKLQAVKGRKVGGTLSWNGSVELTFPMPILPRDSEVFGTVFFDMGSAWRSLRKLPDDPDSIIDDNYKLRTSVGFSVAWASPFGLLSLGYAWPIKKADHDISQKFLFGYGMKFN